MRICRFFISFYILNDSNNFVFFNLSNKINEYAQLVTLKDERIKSLEDNFNNVKLNSEVSLEKNTILIF